MNRPTAYVSSIALVAGVVAATIIGTNAVASNIEAPDRELITSVTERVTPADPEPLRPVVQDVAPVEQPAAPAAPVEPNVRNTPETDISTEQMSVQQPSTPTVEEQPMQSDPTEPPAEVSNPAPAPVADDVPPITTEPPAEEDIINP